jgi:hypothetical protein
MTPDDRATGQAPILGESIDSIQYRWLPMKSLQPSGVLLADELNHLFTKATFRKVA